MISGCQPTSNKDSDQDLGSSSSGSAGLDSIESITSAISSSRGTLNLRDMMRRAAARNNIDTMSGSSGAPGDISPPNMEDNVSGQPGAPGAVASIPSLSWPPEPLDPTSGKY